MVACARFSAIARAVCPCRFQSQARRLDVPPPKSTPAPERHCTASSSYLITRSLTSHILSPTTWVKLTTGDFVHLFISAPVGACRPLAPLFQPPGFRDPPPADLP